MKLSVIIPTHKPIPEFLHQTLTALSNQEGYPNYDVTVVENPNCNVDIQNMVESFGFKYITSDIGSNMARNEGILQSDGDLIALTDDDCLPTSHWISDIITTHYMFPQVGIIGGPLHLKFECERPPWIINDFLPLLSEVDFENPLGGKWAPFELYDVVYRYMVSANISFTRKRYDQAGRLDTGIGLHGKDKYISNDEIQFVERCAVIGHPKMLWVPRLVIQHLIPEQRCEIEFFINKSYGQGYSDARMWQEEHPDLTTKDIYNNFLLNVIMETYVNPNSIMSARAKLCNESMTRLFIENLIKTKTAYVNGAIDYLSGVQV